MGAFHQTGAKQYLGQCNKGCPVGGLDSRTNRGLAPAHLRRVQSYLLHPRGLALLELHKEWNDDKLLSAARKNLTWAMAQQLENGWFRTTPYSSASIPHFIPLPTPRKVCWKPEKSFKINSTSKQQSR